MQFNSYGVCDRCGQRTNTFKTSWFNTDSLCPRCQEVEKGHPDFELARAVEHQACLAGDYNFPGIGLPKDFADYVLRTAG